MKNYTVLLNELVKLRKVIHKGKALKELKKELITISNDANEEPIIMIMGEFKAGKSTFINALLGEELLVSDVNPATAMITMIKYGETRRSEVIFKNGNRENVDKYFYQNASAEGMEIGGILRDKIDYLTLYLPHPLLKNMTLVDSPGLNSPISKHTIETKKFITRADDIIWLFRQGAVGKSTELDEINALLPYGITPLGVMNSIDVHYQKTDQDLDEYLNEEKKKHQHLLKDLIGVSSLDAFESVMENDTQKWEWSNFDNLLKKISLMASNHDQKQDRTIIRLDMYLKKLYTEVTYQMKKDNYEYHSDLTFDFMENRQKALFLHLDKVSISLKELDFKNDTWNLFPNVVTSLSQLKSILNSRHLKGSSPLLSKQINLLFEKIKDYESNVAGYNNMASRLERDYYFTVGKGFGRYKHFFAKKYQMNQLDRNINKLKKQYIYINTLKKTLINFQNSLKEILQREINDIEKTIIFNKTIIMKDHENINEKARSLLRNEHANIRTSLKIIEDYEYLNELQESIERILTLNESTSNEYQQKLVKTLKQFSSIKEYSSIIDELKDNEAKLLNRTIHTPLRLDLPYKLSNQIPLSICSEYTPKVPVLPTYNTRYLRPYSLIALIGLLCLFIFQMNIIPTVTEKIASLSIFDETPVEDEIEIIPIKPIGTTEVMVDYLNVRSGPTLDNEVVGEATRGEQFEVYEVNSNWLRIGDNKWISGVEKYTKFSSY